MSMYAVTANNAQIYIKAGTLPVRMNKLSLYNYDSNDWLNSFYVYPGNPTMSGGSVYTPRPLRDGAPAFSGTVRTGLSVSVTGTPYLVHFFLEAGGSVTQAGYDFHSQASGADAQTPLAITLTPGAVLSLTGTGTSGTYGIAWFEEMRIPGAY